MGATLSGRYFTSLRLMDLSSLIERDQGLRALRSHWVELGRGRAVPQMLKSVLDS